MHFLQIDVSHMGTQRRKYKPFDLSGENVDTLTFHNNEAGREMTIREYFETQYEDYFKSVRGYGLVL